MNKLVLPDYTPIFGRVFGLDYDSAYGGEVYPFGPTLTLKVTEGPSLSLPEARDAMMSLSKATAALLRDYLDAWIEGDR